MRRLAVALVAATVALLAGCAGAPAPEATMTPPPSAAPTAAASPTPTPTADAAPVAPTCETLIVAQTVADLQELGWVARPEPFMVGATEIDGGITCKWGAPNGSGEGLQIFGWAPISLTQADAARAELLANGWSAIDTDEGDFVTESLDTAFATGDQGYGLTYQFGDGWIILADTKQSLLLIERPGG